MTKLTRPASVFAVLLATALMAGCASAPSRLTTASDEGVLRTVTGTVVSIEAKKRSALTATNVAASNVASTRGSSTLGVLALAVDVLDHQSAKSRETYYEIKIINEVTGQEELWESEIESHTTFVAAGDRVRLIKKRYGAEASHNLTRFPHKDALTR
ncbi:hypothetical protein [Acidovorax sp.]|uniref:hypothetical protein n=1 Tax=Acidovorax sp. TaxID=1872122 RepID=UPI00391EFA22